MKIEGAFLVRLVIDLSCLAAVSIPILVLKVSVEPFKRGFFCDDESLMHPHKHDTIPTWLAATASMVIPITIIIIGEGMRHSLFKRKWNDQLYLRHFLGLIYRILGSFLFGIAVTQLSTDIAKYSIGRLRPHFITLCQPNVNMCSSQLGYIEADVCTTTDTEALREARLSFPSGHTSVTVYSFLFIMIYLQINLKWRKCWLLRPFIQTVLFYLTYYTSLSRISDYMHHPSDVLGGAVVGVIVCVLVVFCVSDIYGNRNCCTYVVTTENTPLDSKRLPLYSSNHRTEPDNCIMQVSTETHLSGNDLNQISSVH